MSLEKSRKNNSKYNKTIIKYLQSTSILQCLKKLLDNYLYSKQFLGQYIVSVVFRSVTFVSESCFRFNTIYFLWRTSLKTTYLCDGCFLLKDCVILLFIIYSKVTKCFLKWKVLSLFLRTGTEELFITSDPWQRVPECGDCHRKRSCTVCLQT